MKHDATISGIGNCSHRRYSLTCAEFDELLERSGGRCEICRRTGVDTKHGRLFVDHDPRKGYWAARGLLCASCNTKLANDNAFSEAARAYLARPTRQPKRKPRRQRNPRPGLTGDMAGANELMTAMESVEAEAAEARAEFGRALKRHRDAGLPLDVIVRELDTNRELLRRIQRRYEESLKKA